MFTLFPRRLGRAPAAPPNAARSRGYPQQSRSSGTPIATGFSCPQAGASASGTLTAGGAGCIGPLIPARSLPGAQRRCTLARWPLREKTGHHAEYRQN
jgi:hypothetical protein